MRNYRPNKGGRTTGPKFHLVKWPDLVGGGGPLVVCITRKDAGPRYDPGWVGDGGRAASEYNYTPCVVRSGEIRSSAIEPSNYGLLDRRSNR